MCMFKQSQTWFSLPWSCLSPLCLPCTDSTYNILFDLHFVRYFPSDMEIFLNIMRALLGYMKPYWKHTEDINSLCKWKVPQKLGHRYGLGIPCIQTTPKYFSGLSSIPQKSEQLKAVLIFSLSCIDLYNCTPLKFWSIIKCSMCNFWYIWSLLNTINFFCPFVNRICTFTQ